MHRFYYKMRQLLQNAMFLEEVLVKRRYFSLDVFLLLEFTSFIIACYLLQNSLLLVGVHLLLIPRCKIACSSSLIAEFIRYSFQRIAHYSSQKITCYSCCRNCSLMVAGIVGCKEISFV